MYAKIVREDNTELTGIKSCTYSASVNTGTSLMPGCVSAAHIEVEVYGGQQAAVTAGEKLTYYQVVGGVATQIGVFYAEPSINSRFTYKFSAYDAAAKLDVDFSPRLMELQSSFPMMLGVLVAYAASWAGVDSPSIAPTFGNIPVRAFYADGITCRQIFSWAAELMGQFVQCNTSGRPVFKWYSAKNGYRINPSAGTDSGTVLVAYKENGLNYENYSVAALDAVVLHSPVDGEIMATYPGGVTSGNILHIYGNQLVQATYLQPQTVASTIYSQIHNIPTWRPAEISLFPDENPFHVGDIVDVQDIQGVTFKTLVMSETVSQSGAFVASASNENYDVSQTVGLQSELTGVAVNVNALQNQVADVVGRLDALPYATNPNMLDNWYFGAGVVNQRGQSSYSIASAYGIDRWKAETNTAALTLADDGITLAASANNGCSVWQPVDIPFAALAGKTVTLSILYDGGLVTGTETVPSSIPGAATNVINLSSDVPNGNVCRLRLMANGTFRVQFGQTAGNSLKFIAMKLELGASQTLAHQESSVWVLNELPNYSEQLLKCQRYFQVFRTQSLRPTYGADFRPVMATDTPNLSSFVLDNVTYYTASSES